MGECFFWYRLTRTKGHKTIVVVVVGICMSISSDMFLTKFAPVLLKNKSSRRSLNG